MPRLRPPTVAPAGERYRLRRAGAAIPRDLRRRDEQAARRDPLTPRVRPVVAGEILSGEAALNLTRVLADRGLIDDRTTLGAALGSQPYDADLAALAALATAGLLARTGAGTAAARAIAGTANEIAVSNGDGVAGNPTIALADALVLDTPLCRTAHGNNSETASTTSTVTASPALTLAVVLPAGTWTVRVLGSVNLQHSTGGSAIARCAIDGVAGSGVGKPAPAASYTRFEASQTAMGESGTVTVVVEFLGSTAGTTSAFNPSLIVWAERTA